VLPIARNQHSCTRAETTLSTITSKQPTNYSMVTGDVQQAVALLMNTTFVLKNNRQ
jgi:hypothetical protein